MCFIFRPVYSYTFFPQPAGVRRILLCAVAVLPSPNVLSTATSDSCSRLVWIDHLCDVRLHSDHRTYAGTNWSVSYSLRRLLLTATIPSWIFSQQSASIPKLLFPPNSRRGTRYSSSSLILFFCCSVSRIILPPTYNQTAENVLSLIPGTPQEQSDLIVKMLSCGLLALVVLLPVITNTSIRGGRGVFYRSNWFSCFRIVP